MISGRKQDKEKCYKVKVRLNNFLKKNRYNKGEQYNKKRIDT